MAVGRQDYQAGVVPIKSGYSLSQTPYFDSEGVSIAHGLTYYLCSYTPGAGYNLNITGVRVTTDFPGFQFFTLDIDGATIFAKYYDSIIIDNLPEGSHLIVKAGETVRIKVWNETTITTVYYGEIIGYLEQIVV